MKICALTPLARGLKGMMCAQQTPKLMDDHLVLPDNSVEWTDWGNRIVLLAMAASCGYEWVCWLDHDEAFQEGVTRRSLETDIRECERGGFVGVRYKVKEMWTSTQWRTDGIWNQKGRIVLQKNPLLENSFAWANPPALSRFHNFPVQAGEIMVGQSSILHYGMSTPELRANRLAKWKRYDPENIYQPQGYDYLVDETGLALADAKPMA